MMGSIVIGSKSRMAGVVLGTSPVLDNSSVGVACALVGGEWGALRLAG